MPGRNASQKLPILDFSQFEKDAKSRQAFLDALGSTARDIGFFYLAGHGIRSR